jgi:hypothetical protein
MDTVHKDTFYNLHIPKTGGIYINSYLLGSLRQPLKEKNVEVLSRHDGWKWVNDKTYVVSSFRDPAKRIVSHFAYSARFDIYNEKPLKMSKDGLFKWINKNMDYLSDFQSKNFFYVPKESKMPYFFIKDQDFLNIKDISKKEVLNKINKIDIFFKDQLLNDKTINSAVEKICSDFDISKDIYMNKPRHNDLEISKSLYLELSNSDKDYLYSLNPIDSDIYFDSTLFFS